MRVRGYEGARVRGEYSIVGETVMSAWWDSDVIARNISEIIGSIDIKVGGKNIYICIFYISISIYIYIYEAGGKEGECIP